MVDQFARCQVLVGQALLPVRVCCSDVALGRQECMSYPANRTTTANKMDLDKSTMHGEVAGGQLYGGTTEV